MKLGLPIAVLRLNAVISSFLGDAVAHLQRVCTRVNNTPMVMLLVRKSMRLERAETIPTM